MKVFLLLYAISVASALTSHRAASGLNAEGNIFKRVEITEEGGRPEPKPEIRPRPMIADPPPHDGNRGQPSVPDVARTQPKYPYQEESFAQEDAGKKDPDSGKSVYVDPVKDLPRLAKFYLGLDDETYAKAISRNGFITAVLEDRRYTARSSPESSYNRQRAIGKAEYSAAVEAFGLEPELPSTWEQDNGWWRGHAVDLENKVAMRRYRQTMQLREILWKNPERLQLQLIDNTGSTPPAVKKRDAERQKAPSGPPPVPVNGGPLGQTLLEGPSSIKRSKRSPPSKRGDPLTEITSTVNSPNNDISSLSASFQLYLFAFNIAQSNASSLILLVLSEVVLRDTFHDIYFDSHVIAVG